MFSEKEDLTSLCVSGEAVHAFKESHKESSSEYSRKGDSARGYHLVVRGVFYLVLFS